MCRRRIGQTRAATTRPVHCVSDAQQALGECFLSTLQAYLRGLVGDLRGYTITDVSPSLERTRWVGVGGTVSGGGGGGGLGGGGGVIRNRMGCRIASASRPPPLGAAPRPPAPRSVLLKDSFVDSFPPRDRPFMRQFAETQMFSVYTDAVIGP